MYTYNIFKILSVDKTFLEFYLMINDYCDCICVLKTESIINNNDISGNYIDNLLNEDNFNDEYIDIIEILFDIKCYNYDKFDIEFKMIMMIMLMMIMKL